MASRGVPRANRPMMGGPTMPAERDSLERSPLVDEVFDVEPPPLPRRSRATTGRGSARSWMDRLWRPLSLVGVAILAAVLVGVLSSQPTPSVQPAVAVATDTATVTPTLTAAASATGAPSALATLGPDWQAQIDLPVAALSPDLARTASMAATVPTDPAPSGSPSGSPRGPFLYHPGGAPQSIAVLDIGRATSSVLSAPVKTGEFITATVTDGSWLAVEITAEQPCAPSVLWRLLVVRLVSGMPVSGAKGFKEIARGAVTGRVMNGQDCPQSAPPPIALVAGRIAWVQERDGGKSSAVEVRDLAGTGGQWTFLSDQHVVELALSSEAMAWVESSDPLALQSQWSGARAGIARPDWVAKVAGLSDRAAHEVELVPGATIPPTPPVPTIVLDGSAVIATLFSPDLTRSSVVRADASGRTVIDPWGTEHSCAAQSAVGGVVLLICQWPAIVRSADGQDSPLMLPAVWTRSAGLRVLTFRVDEPTEAMWAASWSGWAILGGRLSWTAVELREIAELGSRG